MPELPEVEIIKRSLCKAIEKQSIVDVKQNRLNLRFPFPLNFINKLKGSSITSFGRKAKYILIYLNNNYVLIVHLGMSGNFLIQKNTPDDDKNIKHTHVVFYTSNNLIIKYIDPRRFGLMDIAKVSEINQHRLLKNIGPDALSNEFNAKYLLKKITNKKCNIKTALLDQNIVGGIGNIYASEALYHSRISPLTSCYGIVNYEDSENNMKKLVKSIKFILNKAIEAGGSTISDHRLPNGDLGYFQNEFNVYNCESKKCNRKHCSGIIKKIKQSGRSTFFCDSCQELQNHEI